MAYVMASGTDPRRRGRPCPGRWVDDAAPTLPCRRHDGKPEIPARGRRSPAARSSAARRGRRRRASRSGRGKLRLVRPPGRRVTSRAPRRGRAMGRRLTSSGSSRSPIAWSGGEPVIDGLLVPRHRWPDGTPVAPGLSMAARQAETHEQRLDGPGDPVLVIGRAPVRRRREHLPGSALATANDRPAQRNIRRVVGHVPNGPDLLAADPRSAHQRSRARQLWSLRAG